MNKKIELLAPAGDLERAKTAIRFGADAVYLGGKRFSLRSRASNFDIEDIKEACDFAKEYGARIFVTVNMIPHEEDLEGLEEYLKTLEAIGVSAVIVASLHIVETVKRVAPKLEAHLSTQMSVVNSTAIKFFEKFKMDRVVLGRECTMEQIKEISSHTSMPLEAFIHGGMCCNYSGRCTLSNAMTLRDANRGGCAQSCRWSYHLMNGEEELSVEGNPFSMSSKDLMAGKYLYDLMEANVASLKIEGRMKSNYYIACIVSAYRRMIDEIARTEQPLSEERLVYYQRELAKGENRPASVGFYAGLPTPNEQLYDSNAGHVTHDFVGLILGYDEEKKRAIVQSRNVFCVGDKIEVFGPRKEPKSFVVEAIYDKEDLSIEKSNKPMEVVSVPIPFEVSEYDMMRRDEYVI
ncbi:MAG: U32 family peptidase [Erysipelotrichaceae bacterium]|nr:U32 family peptidase [Erysipelotrichaceae bacterium]